MFQQLQKGFDSYYRVGLRLEAILFLCTSLVEQVVAENDLSKALPNVVALFAVFVQTTRLFAIYAIDFTKPYFLQKLAFHHVHTLKALENDLVDTHLRKVARMATRGGMFGIGSGGALDAGLGAMKVVEQTLEDLGGFSVDAESGAGPASI